MTIPRGLWLKRAATATPLALLCLALSSAAGPGGLATSADSSLTATSAATVGGDSLRDVVTLAPASVTAGTTSRASASRVRAKKVSVGNGAIPDAALRAYQRAATIIAQSDPTCGLRWELVAAIGRVESDHGRHGESQLDKQGVAKPAIIGVPLNGSGNTARIADTDAGALDGDTKHDRAVGPMQFIPSTWSVVGVDADGDGRRDPQDIDDAALATAVHLCGGPESLTTDAGRLAAVLRYNHSTAYADLVIALEEEYVAGNYSAPPTSTTTSTVPVSARPDLSGVDQRSPKATRPKPTKASPKKHGKIDAKTDTGRKSRHRGKDGIDEGKGDKPSKPGDGPVTDIPGDVPPECVPEEPTPGAGDDTGDANPVDPDPADVDCPDGCVPVDDSEDDGDEQICIDPDDQSARSNMTTEPTTAPEDARS